MERRRRQRKGEGEENVPDCRNGRKTHTQIVISMASHRCQDFFSPQEYHQLLILEQPAGPRPFSWSCRQVSEKTVPTRSTSFRKAAGGGGKCPQADRQAEAATRNRACPQHRMTIHKENQGPLSLAMIGSPGQNGRAGRKAEGKNHWQGS